MTLLISHSLNGILKNSSIIKDPTLENNEISKMFKDDKSSRLDILDVDNNGMKYGTEMRCRKTKDIPKSTFKICLLKTLKKIPTITNLGLYFNNGFLDKRRNR